MKFVSTRGKSEVKNSAMAIAKGLADDGGLFVPEKFPTLSFSELNQMLEIISECGWIIFIFSYIVFRISQASYNRHILLLFIGRKTISTRNQLLFYLVFSDSFHNV